MKKATSPGPDGLTVEFYLAFFPLLAPLFHAMVKESFNCEALPESQNLSYISLLPKDSGSPLELKNYRPISLLNVDYKIISKALTIKLRAVMQHLVHTDQACAVQGRTIQDHNHTLRDIITYTEDKQLDTCILSLDQTKAFDRVSHSFLHKVLEACNLGPTFRKWIEILYKNPQSAVLINQTLSDAFCLGRSVRQGDSLSPLLYVLTLEPLLNKIRQDENISGIKLPGGGEQKIIAFADDTNFFPCNPKSVKRILEHFKQFGKGSGSLINEEKTQILALGKWKTKTNDPLHNNFVQKIKIFGILYTKSRNQNPKSAWKELEGNIQTLLSKLYFKQTSIFGRSLLINTLVLPQINYHTQTLDPPPKIVQNINKHIRQFILKGSIRRIRHSTLIQNKPNGGINLHDIRTKIKAYRLQYMKKIIADKNKHKIAHYYLGTRLTKHTPLDNTTPHYFGTLPTFHRNALDTLTRHAEVNKTTHNTKKPPH